ncbi:hypothetical protein HGRIS_011669 [Hohenbuehelia grisea]|uniref:Chromo domain-containing protein n=1 Tax=Hohenbuehelia grisea TaxID=104357 RepID=A0ABR3JVT6_9AGAR
MAKFEAISDDATSALLTAQVVSALQPILESQQANLAARIDENNALVREAFDEVAFVRREADANARACAETLDGMRKINSALLKLIFERLNGISHGLGLGNDEEGEELMSIVARLDAIENTVYSMTSIKTNNSPLKGSSFFAAGPSGVDNLDDDASHEPETTNCGDEAPDVDDADHSKIVTRSSSASTSTATFPVSAPELETNPKSETHSPFHNRFQPPQPSYLSPLTPASWNNSREAESTRSSPADSDDEPDLDNLLQAGTCASSDNGTRSETRSGTVMPADLNTPRSVPTIPSASVPDAAEADELEDEEELEKRDLERFGRDFFDFDANVDQDTPFDGSRASSVARSDQSANRDSKRTYVVYDIPDDVSTGSDLEDLLPASILGGTVGAQAHTSTSISTIKVDDEQTEAFQREATPSRASTPVTLDHFEAPQRDGLSPMSDLSSLPASRAPSPSPSPASASGPVEAHPGQAHPSSSTSASVSAPPALAPSKLKVRAKGVSAAATRIKKRKAKPSGANTVLDTPERPTKRTKSQKREPASPTTDTQERPTKRTKSQQSESVSATAKTPQWPPVSECTDGFARRAVLCNRCGLTFHYGCVNILRGDPRLKYKGVFKCPVCLVHPKGKRKAAQVPESETPICSRKDCGFKDTEFFVDCIIGRRNRADVPDEYIWLVKWLGYPVSEATWELEDSMADPDKLIAEFYHTARRENQETSPRAPIMLSEATNGGWSNQI